MATAVGDEVSRTAVRAWRASRSRKRFAVAVRVPEVLFMFAGVRA